MGAGGHEYRQLARQGSQSCCRWQVDSGTTMTLHSVVFSLPVILLILSYSVGLSLILDTKSSGNSVTKPLMDAIITPFSLESVSAGGSRLPLPRVGIGGSSSNSLIRYSYQKAVKMDNYPRYGNTSLVMADFKGDYFPTDPNTPVLGLSLRSRSDYNPPGEDLPLAHHNYLISDLHVNEHHDEPHHNEVDAVDVAGLVLALVNLILRVVAVVATMMGVDHAYVSKLDVAANVAILGEVAIIVVEAAEGEDFV